MDDRLKILDEDPCTVNELASHLGCSVSKVRRLVTHGAIAIDDRVVRLETIVTESGMKTSVDAYRRFQIELNTRRDGKHERRSDTEGPGGSDPEERSGAAVPPEQAG